MKINKHLKQDIFLPDEMINHLINLNGYVTFDKNVFCKTVPNIAKAGRTMAKCFGWDYKSSFAATTIYFQTEDNKIYGGLYDMVQNEPVGKRKLIASTPSDSCPDAYIYTPEEIEDMKNKIEAVS